MSPTPPILVSCLSLHSSLNFLGTELQVSPHKTPQQLSWELEGCRHYQPRSVTMNRGCHLEKQVTLESHCTRELDPLLESSFTWDLPVPGRAQAT